MTSLHQQSGDPRIALPRFAPPAIIVLLGLAFFGQLLVSPASMLYSTHSDFVTYHVPYHKYLVHQWRETGELPLWCPEIFGGMPCIQDPQVCAFYPLHLPLYWVSEDHQGSALSYLVVLHVIIAGLGMYAYARHQQLLPPAALVSAVGAMFAGKWMAHLLVAGHHNFAPLAWLPLVLLMVERAIDSRSVRRMLFHTAMAGGLFALIVLGTHPQITIYCGMFIALWTFGTSRLPSERGPGPAAPRRTILRWLLVGAGTAIVGGLLSAIQLWPAMEAVGQSSRSLGVSIGALSLLGSLFTLIGFIGPPVINEATWFWDDRVGVGLLWLTTAIVVTILRPQARARMWIRYGFIWFAFGLLGLAMLQWLPGFHLWRIQSRTMFFLAIPLSLLVGRATQVLFVEAPLDAEQRSQFGATAFRFGLLLIVPLAFYTIVEFRKGTPLRFTAYWPWLVVTLPALWWVLKRPCTKWTYGMWCLLLLGDLWVIALPWTSVMAESELFQRSACVEELAKRTNERGRVLDLSPAPFDTIPSSRTPLWHNLGIMSGIETIRGYNPLDILRYKQFLALIENRDATLKAVNGLTQPVPSAITIRNAALADLLGIRYLLLPDNVALGEVVTDPISRSHWAPVFRDESPRMYSFVATTGLDDSGIIPLPAYTIYENRRIYPRAFVVHEAATLPNDDSLLPTLKTTDFRQRVLLEGAIPPRVNAETDSSTAARADIRVYQPNRVSVDVTSSQPGWLVLTDVWYPGWTCTVDGEGVEMQRANYAFRAVPIPAGSHTVEFRLISRTFRLGQWISSISLALLIGTIAVLGLRRREAV